MADRTLKTHDTADPITGTCLVGETPVDLTVYATVTFFAKATVDEIEVLVSGVCSQANADGTWVYDQLDADVAQAGLYECELECELANGKKVHFPNTQAANPELQLDADLDGA